MFIQTEPTPNPATLKFLPGRAVLRKGTVAFTDAAEAAARSPLAERLFQVEHVTGVFLATDFITVTKDDGIDWRALTPQVLAGIMEHFGADAPVLLDEEDDADADAGASGDTELVSQIKELLDTRVRPAVAQDGGDIVFHSFEDGVVRLHMQGSCSGCPSSTITLKNGIENMLRYYVPDVMRVEAV